MADAPQNYKQLIDLAVGAPSTGLNFAALQCILYSFAEELNIIDKEVDVAKYENITLQNDIEKAASEGDAEEAASEEQELDADVLDEIAKEKLATTNRINELETLLREVQRKVEEGKPNDDISRGIAIMKEQLELAMDQLMIISSVALEIKPENLNLDQLRSLITKLSSIQRENIYIESLHLAVDDQSAGVEEEEFGEELGSESSSDQGVEAVSEESETIQQDEMQEKDSQLIYPSEKLMEKFMEMKADYCSLVNKVNEIQAAMLEGDSYRTHQILEQLQKQMKDIKYISTVMKEAIEQNEAKQTKLAETIVQLSKAIMNLKEDKIDKETAEVLLAGKVDYGQLEMKVSRDEMKMDVCFLEKKICELHNLNDLMEGNVHRMIDELRVSLGYSSVQDILSAFKEKIETDFQTLHKVLMDYIKATNDECNAAGARVNVLQDMSCLSCDAKCVMRSKEKSRLGKLPTASATTKMAPMVAYTLSTIRKPGVMGYCQKDIFPHATNAWLENQKVELKPCVPRHAGGPHTITMAKDHVKKVVLSKRQ